MSKTEIYNKEFLINKAIKFLNENSMNIENMNSRDFAKYAGISTQPIFRNYSNMDEFKLDIRDCLKEKYSKYLAKNVDQNNFLFSLFYNFIKYAKNNPTSFKIIFYSTYASKRTMEEILNSKPNQESRIKIEKRYNLDSKKCEEIYRDLRLYCHGIANQIIYEKLIIKESDVKVLLENMIEKLLK